MNGPASDGPASDGPASDDPPSHGPATDGRASGDDAGPDERTVRRVDDRLGLAIDRVGLSGRTLVTYARDHVTVRTPSRPDFRDGNTIDLLGPPEPAQLPAWVERFRDTIGVMGARHVQVRWETPLPRDVPIGTVEPQPPLVAATRDLGLELTAVTVLLLDHLVLPQRRPAVDMREVGAPSARPGGETDRRWHASTVLYRYFEGTTPDEWRNWDRSFTDWGVDVQRELAAAGRAHVWIASRHGGPVARLTLVHDRQGLAAVQDVVVHPVHRRVGIAAALTHRAVSHHLEDVPGSRVGVGADPGSGAERLYRRLGFRPHATLWTAVRPAGD